MKVAYVAAPYRAETVAGIRENIEWAASLAQRLWEHGCAVICPHMNTAFFDGIVEDKVFLEGDIEILRRCDLVVLGRGWLQSQGAVREVEFALEHAIPVHWSWYALDEPMKPEYLRQLIAESRAVGLLGTS